MTTANVLKQAVQLAGDAVAPKLAVLDGIVEPLLHLPIKQLTNDERQILEIYKAAKKDNLPLLDLVQAIKAGGIDARGFPVLAIASYSTSISGGRVQVNVFGDGALYFTCGGWDDWIRMPEGTLKTLNGFFQTFAYTKRASAPVPLIPPQLRQNSDEDLYVLFEVSEWDQTQLVKIDPYLLRHVAGNIYAVLGTWDVAEKELKAYQAARDLGIE